MAFLERLLFHDKIILAVFEQHWWRVQGVSCVLFRYEKKTEVKMGRQYTAIVLKSKLEYVAICLNPTYCKRVLRRLEFTDKELKIFWGSGWKRVQ